nr:MAG TPA_asm: hypothetical protein [Caudoviricetes sp.]
MHPELSKTQDVAQTDENNLKKGRAKRPAVVMH